MFQLLPAATAKAGIVFNVSVCAHVNKPKDGSGDMSCSVNHHVNGCDFFGRTCLFRCFGKMHRCGFAVDVIRAVAAIYAWHWAGRGRGSGAQESPSGVQEL